MLRFTTGATGTALVVVSGPRALLVRLPDDATRVEALWEAVSAGSLQQVVEVLTSAGLSSTPPFAVFETSADSGTGVTVNCIVRGDLGLALTTTTGTEVIDTSTVSTWVERAVSGVVAFTVMAADGGGSALPIAEGAVWASSLAWTAPGSAVAAPTAPVPAAKAAPVVVAPSVKAPAPTAAAAAPTAAAPAAAKPPAAAPVPAVAEPAIAEPAVAEQTIAAQTVTSAAIDELVTAAAATADDSAAGEYDKLFEETVVRSIADAAVRPPSEDEDAAAAIPEESAGDHDGLTVMSVDIAKVRAARGKAPKSKAPEPVAAPVYTLRLSTGGSETLDGIALVGRSPSVSKVSGGRMPKLIAIPGEQDISRNHVQFALEGDTVVVTDLHSRNGTSIVLPGKSPQLLRQGEPTAVLVDTVVDLGGGVTITVGQDS